MRFTLALIVALVMSSVAQAQCQDGKCLLAEPVRTTIKIVAQPISRIVQAKPVRSVLKRRLVRGLVRRLRARRCR